MLIYEVGAWRIWVVSITCFVTFHHPFPSFLINQSIIWAVFDPMGEGWPFKVLQLLLSSVFLLNCSYLLSPLHLFMSSNHILRCLPTPCFPSIVPSIIPSNTLVISLPLDPRRMCPAYSNFLSAIFFIKYLSSPSSSRTLSITIWHKSSPANLEHSPVAPHLKSIYPSFCFLCQCPRLWSICKTRKDIDFNDWKAFSGFEASGVIFFNLLRRAV